MRRLLTDNADAILLDYTAAAVDDDENAGSRFSNYTLERRESESYDTRARPRLRRGPYVGAAHEVLIFFVHVRRRSAVVVLLRSRGPHRRGAPRGRDRRHYSAIGARTTTGHRTHGGGERSAAVGEPDDLTAARKPYRSSGRSVRFGRR